MIANFYFLFYMNLGKKVLKHSVVVSSRLFPSRTIKDTRKTEINKYTPRIRDDWDAYEKEHVSSEKKRRAM